MDYLLFHCFLIPVNPHPNPISHPSPIKFLLSFFPCRFFFLFFFFFFFFFLILKILTFREIIPIRLQINKGLRLLKISDSSLLQIHQSHFIFSGISRRSSCFSHFLRYDPSAQFLWLVSVFLFIFMLVSMCDDCCSIYTLSDDRFKLFC